MYGNEVDKIVEKPLSIMQIHVPNKIQCQCSHSGVSATSHYPMPPPGQKENKTGADNDTTCGERKQIPPIK